MAKAENSIQSENWYYIEERWERVGVSSLEKVLHIHGIDSPQTIFSTKQYNLDDFHARRCAYSLCLLKIYNVSIVVKDNIPKMNFTYNNNEYKYFGLSQIELRKEYCRCADGSYYFSDELYVVCSLTGKYDRDGKYYKMVAQILY